MANVTDSLQQATTAYVTAWSTAKIASVAPSAPDVNKAALSQSVKIGGTSAPLATWLMLGLLAVGAVWLLKH